MKTIVFPSIKGGSGKSSNSIMLSNFLGQAGMRVLCIDMDINNSMSFYYVSDAELMDTHSIADALHSGDLSGNVIPTDQLDNIHIIPSSFHLVNLRAISHMTLKRMLPQVSESYDYCIIDSPPTWDNIVLNALYAADLVITPVSLAQWDWKGASFFRDQIVQDLGPEFLERWYLLINYFVRPRTDNPENFTNQLIQLFNDSFENILPFRIPETTLVERYIDLDEGISKSKRKIKLFSAVQELVQFVTGSPLDVEVF
ncbi:MAG: ParA family protein [Spirochaetales bacterium]|nr:ParA family protein [Spirochaetales bacterium]